MSIRSSLGLAVLAFLGACAMQPVHVDQLHLVYATAPQPARVTAPLRVLVDATKVPDTVRTRDPQTKPIDIYGLQTFVRRDVKNVLGDFFTDVAVADAVAPPATAGYVAEVRIVRLDTTADARTSLSTDGTVESSHRAFGVMDWSVVLRDAASGEVVYSFSDRAVGSFAANTVHETGGVVSSVLEIALIRFAQDLRAQNLVALIQAHARPAAPPPASVATPAATTSAR